MNINEVLSLSEIRKRYVSQWVLLEDPETNDLLEVERGKVLWHSPDRSELYRRAVELKPKSSAILYAGKFIGEAILVV